MGQVTSRRSYKPGHPNGVGGDVSLASSSASPAPAQPKTDKKKAKKRFIFSLKKTGSGKRARKSRQANGAPRPVSEPVETPGYLYVSPDAHQWAVTRPKSMILDEPRSSLEEPDVDTVSLSDDDSKNKKKKRGSNSQGKTLPSSSPTSPGAAASASSSSSFFFKRDKKHNGSQKKSKKGKGKEVKQKGKEKAKPKSGKAEEVKREEKTAEKAGDKTSATITHTSEQPAALTLNSEPTLGEAERMTKMLQMPAVPEDTRTEADVQRNEPEMKADTSSSSSSDEESSNDKQDRKKGKKTKRKRSSENEQPHKLILQVEIAVPEVEMKHAKAEDKTADSSTSSSDNEDEKHPKMDHTKDKIPLQIDNKGGVSEFQVPETGGVEEQEEAKPSPSVVEMVEAIFEKVDHANNVEPEGHIEVVAEPPEPHDFAKYQLSSLSLRQDLVEELDPEPSQPGDFSRYNLYSMSLRKEAGEGLFQPLVGDMTHEKPFQATIKGESEVLQKQTPEHMHDKETFKVKTEDISDKELFKLKVDDKSGEEVYKPKIEDMSNPSIEHIVDKDLIENMYENVFDKEVNIKFGETEKAESLQPKTEDKLEKKLIDSEVEKEEKTKSSDDDIVSSEMSLSAAWAAFLSTPSSFSDTQLSFQMEEDKGHLGLEHNTQKTNEETHRNEAKVSVSEARLPADTRGVESLAHEKSSTEESSSSSSSESEDEKTEPEKIEPQAKLDLAVKQFFQMEKVLPELDMQNGGPSAKIPQASQSCVELPEPHAKPEDMTIEEFKAHEELAEKMKNKAAGHVKASIDVSAAAPRASGSDQPSATSAQSVSSAELKLSEKERKAAQKREEKELARLEKERKKMLKEQQKREAKEKKQKEKEEKERKLKEVKARLSASVNTTIDVKFDDKQWTKPKVAAKEPVLNKSVQAEPPRRPRSSSAGDVPFAVAPVHVETELPTPATPDHQPAHKIEGVREETIVAAVTTSVNALPFAQTPAHVQAELAKPATSDHNEVIKEVKEVFVAKVISPAEAKPLALPLSSSGGKRSFDEKSQAGVTTPALTKDSFESDRMDQTKEGTGIFGSSVHEIIGNIEQNAIQEEKIVLRADPKVALGQPASSVHTVVKRELELVPDPAPECPPELPVSPYPEEDNPTVSPSSALPPTDVQRQQSAEATRLRPWPGLGERDRSHVLRRIELGPRLRTAILRKSVSSVERIVLTQPRHVQVSNLNPPPRKQGARKPLEQAWSPYPSRFLSSSFTSLPMAAAEEEIRARAVERTATVTRTQRTQSAALELPSFVSSAKENQKKSAEDRPAVAVVAGLNMAVPAAENGAHSLKAESKSGSRAVAPGAMVGLGGQVTVADHSGAQAQHEPGTQEGGSLPCASADALHKLAADILKQAQKEAQEETKVTLISSSRRSSSSSSSEDDEVTIKDASPTVVPRQSSTFATENVPVSAELALRPEEVSCGAKLVSNNGDELELQSLPSSRQSHGSAEDTVSMQSQSVSGGVQTLFQTSSALENEPVHQSPSEKCGSDYQEQTAKRRSHSSSSSDSTDSEDGNKRQDRKQQLNGYGSEKKRSASSGDSSSDTESDRSHKEKTPESHPSTSPENGNDALVTVSAVETIDACLSQQEGGGDHSSTNNVRGHCKGSVKLETNNNICGDSQMTQIETNGSAHH